MEEKKIEKKWIIIGVVAVALILISYFMRASSERMAEITAENYIENAIEAQNGGKVDVDVSDNSYSFETEEGSFRSGENVELPANFPSDVYVYEGKLLAVMQTSDKAVSVSIETDKKISEVRDVYVEKLKADGWEQTGIMDFGDTASVMGKKGERTLSVVMSSDSSGKTNIALTVAEGSAE